MGVGEGKVGGLPLGLYLQVQELENTVRRLAELRDDLRYQSEKEVSFRAELCPPTYTGT